MTTQTLAPTAHSHSRLQNFVQCPLSYKLMYMDKVPQESGDALEIGAAAHEFFDQWVKNQCDISENETMNPSLEETAAKCFQKEPRNQDNFKDYLEICQTFASAYKPDPAYPHVITEQQVAFNRQWKQCGWFESGVMFRAKIDLIEVPGDIPQLEVKRIRITDYKTGYAGAPDSFQLDVYALVASLIYPALEQVEVCFYYVKSGFKQTKLLEVKDMGVTKIQLEALMARIEGEKKWKARPGQRCLSCPVAASCTEKPSDLVKIDSMDTAKVLGGEIAFLEAQAKAKKKALNTFCKQNGPVETNGLVFNHWPVESIHVEMAPLLSACVNFQVDPAEILNPDGRAIKKAIKTVPGFGEAVTPYIGVDVTTRFASKKADGDE